MLQAGFNKSYSHRPPLKWRQNVQNSSGTTSHSRVVSSKSFEHFDVISIGDKSTNRRFVLYNNIDRFWRPLPLKFIGKSCARERKINIASSWRHVHDLLFDNSTQLISAQESPQLKISFDFVHKTCLAFIQPYTSTNRPNTPVSTSVEKVPKRRTFS